MKYKFLATVDETSGGTKLTLYKRFLFCWRYEDGLKPITTAYFLIDEFLNRWKVMYGDGLLIKDNRITELQRT